MKDYKEIANNVFQRRDKYLEEKKRKKAVIFRNAAIALSCCIMIAVGIGIWNSGMLRNIKPSPNKEDYSLPQPIVTTTEAASDNNAAVTATVEASTDNIITTAAPVTNVSAQSEANAVKTTTAEKQSGGSNVTATRSDNKTGADPSRTTASSIEITSPSNNSAQHSRTTSYHSGAATTTRNPALTTATRSSSRTTSRTTTPPRTTSRTTLPPVATTTIAKTTRVYTSTTAVYTTRVYTSTTAVYTTRVYTSTTIVYTYSPVATSTTMATSTRPAYSTTIGYTSMSHSHNVYTSTVPAYSTTATKSPELTSTTSMVTTIPTEIFANHTIYDILPNTIPDIALAHDYIGSSSDRYACNLYKYMDFDPDFLCLALFSNNESRLAASYEYSPETIGEIIDTQGFWNNLSVSGFYDYKAKRYTRYNDKDSLYGFLDSVRDTRLEEGLFLNTETDNNLIAALYYNIYVSYDDAHLSGVIYLTDNGILQVNIDIEALELQYAFKIGEQSIEQLYSTLRSNV